MKVADRTHTYLALPNVFHSGLCAFSGKIAGCIVGTCPPPMSIPHQPNYSNTRV